MIISEDSKLPEWLPTTVEDSIFPEQNAKVTRSKYGRVGACLTQGSHFNLPKMDRYSGFIIEPTSLTGFMDQTDIYSVAASINVKNGFQSIFDDYLLKPINRVGFTKYHENFAQLVVSQIEALTNRSFQDAVEKSQCIIDLEEGWDDEEAKPIDEKLFNESTNRIRSYLLEVSRETGNFISSPKINPVVDGSIDFEWSLKNVRLLINVRQTEKRPIAYYFGDLNNKELSIKGNVPLDCNYEHLSKWMKFLARG
ncbi:hypothetical protein [Pedobacter hiemivivus]|uniref:Uncharacterized protein n=1 Tax=Pedobacter hiemivivus TaxID=2530454 RepID=A0A4R0NDM8_9SPHI|nr:hypothetical protein [Pedobacter hiemivivus]TCC98490.1 hypothetical protein EZ444_04190 [Pedobacter hiemivivus]